MLYLLAVTQILKDIFNYFAQSLIIFRFSFNISKLCPDGINSFNRVVSSTNKNRSLLILSTKPFTCKEKKKVLNLTLGEY